MKCITFPWLGRVLTVMAFLGVGLLSLPGSAQERKTPVPGMAERERGDAFIRKVFKADFVRAKDDPKAARELGASLFKQAAELQDDAPLRFVALSLARDLALLGEDFRAALEAIEEMDRIFEVKAAPLKSTIFAAAVRKLKDKDAASSLAESALDLISQAVDDDDFETALRLVDAAEQAAAFAKETDLTERVQKASQEVKTIHKEYERIKPLLAKLKDEDIDANGAVGRFYCLIKGQWARGLPYLTRAEPEWRALASADLTNPKAPKAQIALGDGWWNLSEKEKPPGQWRLQERAAFWYEQIALVPAEDQMRIEKRLEVVLDRALKSGNIVGPVGKVPVGEIRRFIGHMGPVRRGEFSPDGRRIISSGNDGTLRIWEVETAKEMRMIRAPQPGDTRTVFFPNGKQALLCNQQVVLHWDLEKDSLIRQFELVADQTWCLAVSANGKFAATGHPNSVVQLWDAATGKEIRRFMGHTGGVANLAFSRDGRHLFTGSHDNTARYWSVETGKEIFRFQTKSFVIGAALSPDGRWGVCGGWDNLVHLFDVKSGKEVRTFQGHTGPIYTVAFSPDSRRVLSAGQKGTLRLWDVASGMQLQQFTGHTGSVDNVHFAPHGRYAASAGEDGTIRLWGLPK